MKRLKKNLLLVFKFIMYIILSLLLALGIRVFVCNFYVIPSDSMESGIVPGDFILADKWTYGGRIFTSLKFDRDSDPPVARIRGIRNVRRNDVVVFNFPYRYKWDTIRMNLEQIFVKRCIGLPGDTISAVGGFYHIAGLADTPGNMAGQKQMLYQRPSLDSIIIRAAAFDQSLQWDIFDFGPFYIPAAGATIALTPENFKLYRKLIVFETCASVRLEDSLVYISDTVRHAYTFRGNWYFMAGDKVINSQDSRYIGLIPEDYIIGRATLVLTSKDRNTEKRRWGRTFKRIT